MNRLEKTRPKITSMRENTDCWPAPFFLPMDLPDDLDLNSNSELSGSGLFGGVVSVDPIGPPPVPLLRFRLVLNHKIQPVKNKKIRNTKFYGIDKNNCDYLLG